MPNTTAGVYYPGGSQSPNVPADMAAMAASINTKVIGVYADTAARDAAYSGLTSAQKLGIQAWVTNRQGYSYWDPTSNNWKWMGQNRIIANIDQVANVATSTVAYRSLMSMPSAVTLPPGNRLIQVAFSGFVTQTATGAGNGECTPRISVSGSGMGAVGASNTVIQGYLPGAVGWQISLSRTWQYILSGTVNIDVQCAIAPANGILTFSGGRLDVTDCGPSDG